LLFLSPSPFLVGNGYWLTQFAYRIHIGIGVFLLSFASIFLIAFATISYQTLKAVLANPVSSLAME
jgi:hypothetical protein